jgi:signal transduction histidine kinase
MEAVGQLTGGVAHDFNNILAVIMGYSGMIAERLGRTARSKACRTIARVGRAAVDPATARLPPPANGATGRARPQRRGRPGENAAAAHWREHRNDDGDRLKRIKADSGYVGQVLMNLVVNARDAMPNGSKLTIATNDVTLDETTRAPTERHSRRLHNAQCQ